MTWSDIPFKPTTKALRQFAAAWLVFFLAFGAHQYLARRHPGVGLTLMGIAVVTGLLGLIEPGGGALAVCGLDGGGVPDRVVHLARHAGSDVLWDSDARGGGFSDARRDLLRRKPAPDRDSFWLPKETPMDVPELFPAILDCPAPQKPRNHEHRRHPNN